MEFRLGRSYTRQQIHAVLGGTLVGYLPHVDDRVVCGAFDPRHNPNAPEVVLVGDGPKIRRYAETLRRQRIPIPVFLKVAPLHWQYVGTYRPDRLVTAPTAIARYAQGSRRTDITAVLLLVPSQVGGSSVGEVDLEAREGRTLMRLHTMRERHRGIVQAKRKEARRSGCFRCEVCNMAFDGRGNLTEACADFILWIRNRKTKATRLVFLDPHGLHHEGVMDNDRFAAIEKLRALGNDGRFKANNIGLDGYILAPANTTPDRIPGAKGMTWADLEGRFPLLRQDGAYIEKALAGR